MADPGERRRPSREFHGSSQPPSSSSSRPVRRRISDDNDEQPAPKTHAGGAGDEQRPSASGRRRHGSSDSRSSSRAGDDRSSSARGGRSGAGDEERPSTSRGRRQENSSESRSGAHAGAGDAPRDERSRRGRRDNLEIIHTRPKDCENKTGNSGDPVRLQTNYYRLRKSGNWSIYQYKVTFEPAIEMRRLAAGILSNHRELFGTGYLFDGSLLFNTVKLANKETILNTESKSGEKYTITIKYVGKIEMTQSQSLQILNLILRRSMQGLDLQLVGRNFYDPHALVDLREHRIQLWPGYVTSIRQHETDLLLNVEISHKVMRTETVYDILKKCARESADFQDAFKRQVIGMTVLTDYNNKTYRIIEVSFGASPKDTFSMKGKDTTFMDYYKEKYNLRVRDPNQPLLVTQSRDKQFGKNAGDDRPIVLIPEFCRATGMTEEMRSNFNLMRAMADHTRMNPDRRIERLRAFNSRLRNAEQSVKVLNEWKLELDRDLVEVKGRILEPQRIKFGTGSVPGTREADWTRCFRDNSMFSQPSRGLYRWYAVAPNRNLRDMRNFIQAMMRVARGLRIDIQQPEEKVLYDDRTHSYIQALEDCARSDPQMIFVLASNNNAERYNAIKKKCCLDRAIPTQVVTQKCAGNARGLMSIATKVAIQINCKLGYTPWTVDIPLSGLMTIGYDVVRSTKDRSKAFGAIVATMDMKVNPTYYSTVAECGANEVVATHIWPMIVKALRQYRAESGDALPNRIILYRDGVSDGSLAQVYSQEVQLIVNNLKKVYEQSTQDKKPKFAFINVTKSMNTRFFIQSNQRPQNPPPGTVVDSVVTLPEHYDFYLVSQSVRQGTVSPTLYKVLYSSLGLSPDQIQMLTYKMCHLYYNWSGTTRVPAVCQYAKKLATLVSTSLHNTPEAALEKKLYYL